MILRSLSALAAVLAVLSSRPAQADMIIGGSIVVPEDTVSIAIEMISRNAGYTGQLSFLGSGTQILVTVPAADTDQPGLGQQLFINQSGVAGDTIVLDGSFQAGDVLHFAYRVFEPVEAEDVLRTDETQTANQFGWDPASHLLSIEDLRPDHPQYDADFNDLIVRITFNSIPTPGTAALTGMAGLLLAVKRARRP